MTQPPIDAALERSLAHRARAGDKNARDELITAGMRSVALRAMLHGYRGDEMRDAVQSGAVGLIRAVDRFDPDRGARLATYAWHWIGSAMRPTEPREEPLDDIERADVEHNAEAFDLGVDDLPDELARVVRLRFGLDRTLAAMTRPQVATHLGLTVAQVRQREDKAMRHLSGSLAKVVHRAPSSGADPL